MNPELVILSPHLDDAAFSCGTLIRAALGRAQMRVVNIFTRSAYAPFAPGIETMGLTAVTELRQVEDAAMLELLRDRTGDSIGLEAVDLHQLDAPLRLSLVTEEVQGHPISPALHESEVQRVAALLRPLVQNAQCVLVPLGLGGAALEGHIDHRITRDAAFSCVAPELVALYEDSPYAARMDREQREHAIAAYLGARNGFQPVLVSFPDAALAKAELARCYTSQIDTDTIAEIADYTAGLHGERFYAGRTARGILESLL